MKEHKKQGCCCGHEHHEHHEHHCDRPCDHVTCSAIEKVYIIENLGCANCAAKMERKINELPEVEVASLSFATKQLRVLSNHHEVLLPVLQDICENIESEVKVKVQEEGKKHTIETGEKKQNQEIWVIGISILLFIFGFVFKNILEFLSAGAFVLGYLLLGSPILKTATKNLFKGHVFDENFLMSIATLAAFAIGDFEEAVGIMLFFRIGEYFEENAVEKSRNQIMEAVDLRPETVQILHDHGIHTIPASEAKVGEVLVVRVGDRIPLDACVIDGESLIDTSAVTGEPVPIRVAKGERVISGCINTSGVLHIRVEKTLEDSMVTRILRSVEHAAASKPKIDRFITRFARVYTPIVVGFAVATAIVPSLLFGDWDKWMYTAITFLVISCPCALVLSVPLAFFSGIGAGSKKGILFKSGLAIETLKQVKTVVMDKTGTITKGSFEVQKCISLSQFDKDTILEMAATSEMQSTHPIASSIVQEAARKGMELKRPSDLEEMAGKGVCATTQWGKVLCGNRALMENFHVDISMLEETVGTTEVLLACDGILVGYIVIADVLKEDAKSAIQELKNQKIKTVMLTGDNEWSAKVIAEECGVEEVHAHLFPEEKLEKLQDVRKRCGKVLFVGDGINDAPVLAGADIGAAMGSGADAAIEAADVVFMTSALQAIPEAFQIAKITDHIAIQNVVFALLVKAVVMILGFAGFANMWMAVFADTGVAMLCVLNAVRILKRK